MTLLTQVEVEGKKYNIPRSIRRARDSDKKIEYYIQNEIPVPEELIKQNLGEGAIKSFKYSEKNLRGHYRDDGTTPALIHDYGVSRLLKGLPLAIDVGNMHDDLETSLKKKKEELSSDKFVISQLKNNSELKAGYLYKCMTDAFESKPYNVEQFLNFYPEFEDVVKDEKFFSLEKKIESIKKQKLREFLDLQRKQIFNKFGKEVLIHLDLVTNYYDLGLKKVTKEHKEKIEKKKKKKYFEGIILQENKDKLLNYILHIDDITRYVFGMVFEKDFDTNKLDEVLTSSCVKLADVINNVMSRYSTDLKKTNLLIRKGQYVIDSFSLIDNELSEKGIVISHFKRLMSRLIDETNKQTENILLELSDKVEKRRIDYWKEIHILFSNYRKKYRGKGYEIYVNYILEKAQEEIPLPDWDQRIGIEIDSRLRNLERDNPPEYSYYNLKRNFYFLSKLKIFFIENNIDNKSLLYKNSLKLYNFSSDALKKKIEKSKNLLVEKRIVRNSYLHNKYKNTEKNLNVLSGQFLKDLTLYFKN